MGKVKQRFGRLGSQPVQLTGPYTKDPTVVAMVLNEGPLLVAVQLPLRVKFSFQSCPR